MKKAGTKRWIKNREVSGTLLLVQSSLKQGSRPDASSCVLLANM